MDPFGPLLYIYIYIIYNNSNAAMGPHCTRTKQRILNKIKNF
nr:MAG TPA: hypothetical protein [Caudoviricetes sp.]